jgi:hypothetical protein
MQKVDKEKTRYYLAKIHILFRGNFRTQVLSARPCPFLQCSLTDECPFFLFFRTAGDIHHAYVNFYKKLLVLYLKFESKIAVLGGFKPRTAIFLYVLYRPSFKFVKKFFYPWLVL